MKNLYDNFISMETGDKLKSLGCDENGFSFYWDGKTWKPRWLHQQAIDWLRENHNLHIEIVFAEKPDQFYYYIGDTVTGNMWRGSNTTYEIARIDAIDKAIQIISIQTE